MRTLIVMSDIKIGRPTADLIELVSMLGGLFASLVMAGLVLSDTVPFHGGRGTAWIMAAPLIVVIGIGYLVAAIVRRAERPR